MKTLTSAAMPSAPPLDRAAFLDDVLRGLQAHPRQLPCKYFYDAWGSRLFEEICELPEYYLARTERAIMSQSIAEIVEAIGPGSVLIEYGSGSSLKTCLILDRAPRLAGYIPIDISHAQLQSAAAALANRYPRIPIRPLCADYTRPYRLPHLPGTRRVVYFPGSTIGNFPPPAAAGFLCHIARVCGPGGGLLIGVDLKKDPALLVPAYNDARGVTAAFNINLLQRINREFGADFHLDRFFHHARYDNPAGRIEMHLVSMGPQTVHLQGRHFTFTAGESIWTESSYKYSLEEFGRLAATAGFRVSRVWTDPARLFSVQYLTVEAGKNE